MKRRSGQDPAITSRWRPATRALRGGTWRSEHGETSEALFLTSGYTYDDAQTCADRFAGVAEGMTYSRLQNPTVEMLEQRIALLEGAEACRATATGMAAMTAARVGEPALAVDFLLMDTPKNRYHPNGHNYQRPGLTIYLPGNGGLLAAVAMMAAGWDGAPPRYAQGFPQDGKWTVRWEGLHKLP